MGGGKKSFEVVLSLEPEVLAMLHGGTTSVPPSKGGGGAGTQNVLPCPSPIIHLFHVSYGQANNYIEEGGGVPIKLENYGSEFVCTVTTLRQGRSFRFIKGWKSGCCPPFSMDERLVTNYGEGGGL